METEEERKIRRQERIERMKREKRRAELINRLFPAACLAVFAICIVCVVLAVKGNGRVSGDVQTGVENTAVPGAETSPVPRTASKAKREEPAGETPEPSEEPKSLFAASSTAATIGFAEDIISQYGIFIDVEKGTILAQREAYARMNPASMTKILTLLVAAEHIGEEQLEDTVPITIDITDYCYVNDCSIVGFSLNENVPVKQSGDMSR